MNEEQIMICEDLKRKRTELKMLERLRRRGGATLVVGEPGSVLITVFYNTKRIRHA